MSPVVIEAVVGEDGELRLGAAELAAHGVGPGDRVQVLSTARRRRVRSMLGAYARPVGFEEAHLRELRREMGSDTGGDLTR